METVKNKMSPERMRELLAACVRYIAYDNDSTIEHLAAIIGFKPEELEEIGYGYYAKDHEPEIGKKYRCTSTYTYDDDNAVVWEWGKVYEIVENDEDGYFLTCEMEDSENQFIWADEFDEYFEEV